jgi:hypothetical protein
VGVEDVRSMERNKKHVEGHLEDNNVRMGSLGRVGRVGSKVGGKTVVPTKNILISTGGRGRRKYGGHTSSPARGEAQERPHASLAG